MAVHALFCQTLDQDQQQLSSPPTAMHVQGIRSVIVTGVAG
jgi:hypothetical protein